MNAVARNEKEQARSKGNCQTSSNIVAEPPIPEYSEVDSDTTFDEEPDLDGDIHMSHAEQDPVMSNEPGKPVDDKDCAEAS